jgi:outer membrane immunogenic protein
MKNQLIAALALTTLVGGSAIAADIPTKAPRAVAPGFVCAGHQWAGGYIGAHAGGAYHNAHRWASFGAHGGPDNDYNIASYGFIGGGQIGYNWTTCSTVWGIEVDGAWASNRRRQAAEPNLALGELGNVTPRFDGLVTARTRAGVALDSVLLYVTGGVAGVHLKTSYLHLHPASVESTGAINEWRLGWVAGFGAEWAWTRNWSLRSETLFVGTSTRDLGRSFAGPQGANNFFRHSDQIVVSRIGINYRWGGAPVVARY